ncbi:hypothetical protein FKP32DRAFT_1680949 [Trametes sanguinea]|nr:hypothetical protein FKP32DRAFT_1680949 [Trametes sanguinea]
MSPMGPSAMELDGPSAPYALLTAFSSSAIQRQSSCQWQLAVAHRQPFQPMIPPPALSDPTPTLLLSHLGLLSSVVLDSPRVAQELELELELELHLAVQRLRTPRPPPPSPGLYPI